MICTSFCRSCRWTLALHHDLGLLHRSASENTDMSKTLLSLKMCQFFVVSLTLCGAWSWLFWLRWWILHHSGNPISGLNYASLLHYPSVFWHFQSSCLFFQELWHLITCRNNITVFTEANCLVYLLLDLFFILFWRQNKFFFLLWDKKVQMNFDLKAF